jgi:hypothetical protein
MAFVPKDPNLEDEQGQGQAEPGVPSPAGESSALGTGAAPGGTAGGKATPQNRTASSSGFTNLNKYISANKPQAAQLGSQIGAKVGDTINQASEAASSVDKGYAEKVNPNQYAFDAKKFDPLKQDRAQFQNLFAAPKSSFGAGGEVENANKLIDTAKTKVGQTETIGGRKELINDQQTLSKEKGVNTAGLRSFDNLLLQSSDEGKAALAASRGQLENAGLEARLQEASNRAKAVDTQAATNQKQAADAARAALTSSGTAFNKDLDKRAEAAKGTAFAEQNALNEKVMSFQKLSPAELQRLGISGEDWDQARSLARNNKDSNLFKSGGLGGAWDVGSYLNQTGDLNKLGRQNVATADDLARARALAELGGFAGVSLGGMPTQASQFDTDVADLDIGRLLADLTPAEVEKVIATGGKAENLPGKAATAFGKSWK